MFPSKTKSIRKEVMEKIEPLIVEAEKELDDTLYEFENEHFSHLQRLSDDYREKCATATLAHQNRKEMARKSTISSVFNRLK